MGKPKIGGKKSKRLSCRKRYKIEKKVRQHNKKLKKTSNVSLKKKSRKDPGVPNNCPFKGEILKEAEARKEKLETERQRQMEKRKRERQKLVDKKRSLETIVHDARKESEDFERQNAFVAEKSVEYSSGKAVENSLKAYYREVKKVIEASDVVIEVLDARDPLGSRCPQVEETVLGSGPAKKLILLLNKIDLVPKENVEAWLKYLRNEFPAVAFKACTQTQTDRLSHSKVPLSLASNELRKSSRCLGADLLMTLLGNYCRNHDIKTAITIGIVGFPNTGKSSVINSLKRSKACHVGATPGVTKTMQVIQLDKHIKLLDSPGVVMATSSSDAAVILRNCVRLETVEDPVTPVAAILTRCNKQQMMIHYGLGDFANVHEFLALLAKKQGKLRKGGLPDINKAARLVLKDWNIGKITYYTHPPEVHTMSAHLNAEIVAEMSKAFDIDALLAQETSTLNDLKVSSPSDIVMESDGRMDAVWKTDEDIKHSAAAVEPMEETPSAELDVIVNINPIKKKINRNKKSATVKTTQAPVVAGAPQMNRDRKNDFKKLKKQRRRADVLSGTLATALCDGLAGLGGSTDDYNFATDFKSP